MKELPCWHCNNDTKVSFPITPDCRILMCLLKLSSDDNISKEMGGKEKNV